MDKKPSECIDGFLRTIREAQEDHNISRSQERDADMETQDILHWIEFHEVPGPEDAVKICKGLKDVRTGRRKAKNTAETAGPAAEWAEGHKSTINGLEQLLGDTRKTEKAVENRQYTDRTDVMERILGKEEDNGQTSEGH